jgi:hypothetical protein
VVWKPQGSFVLLIKYVRRRTVTVKKYTIKLMVDYHCWPLWWAGEHEPGNIDPTSLPLSDELVARLTKWAETLDAKLDHEDPSQSGFASTAEAQTFDEEGLELWSLLREELGPQYVVFYHSWLEQREL